MNSEIIKHNLLDNLNQDSDTKSPQRFPLHLVLDNVRSAFNVGSAFRTGDAARVEKIHLCGITAYPPNKKLEKTALGATDSVPWQYHSQTIDAINQLKAEKIPICVVELTNRSVNFWEYDFPQPVALVFGHEVTGVSDKVLPLADSFIHLPMHGAKVTMNVATVLGITLFEAVRQWNQKT